MKAKSANSTQLEIKKKKRIGDLMVAHGIVTQSQLQQALKRQSQVGGHIGSILIEMGYLSNEQLLKFLSKQTGVPSLNLYKYNINQRIVGLIPIDKINTLKVLPVAANEHVVTVAMVNPHDFEAISEIGFLLGKKIKPVVVPSFMMDAAKKSLFQKASSGLSGKRVAQVAQAEQQKVKETQNLYTLLKQMVEARADDMLLTAGVPPSLKISNEMTRLVMAPLTPVDCENYARELLSDREWRVFGDKNDYDLAVTYPEIGRFRISVYRQRNSVSISIRALPDSIPSFKDLNLPEWLSEFALKHQGLIMISGPAGHGKSTTMGALVDVINRNRRCNIVSLEDPVEYLHVHKLSNINQREVGRDTESFYEGMRHVFRQAPDVIIVGEMRDKESFEIALKAANTGHLVLSTVHANNSTSVIESVVTMFEPHKQALIRVMLADSLILSLSQRLIPRKKGSGRILATEKLVNSHRIKNRIREQKTHHIRTQMQTGSEDFSSLDVSLVSLYKRGLIIFEDGLRFAEDKQYYHEATSMHT